MKLWQQLKILAIAVAAVASIGAARAQTPQKSPSEIIAEAPASAWEDVSPDDLIVFKLKDGTSFTMQLATQYAPIHADNIKKLVRAGWFDSAAIVRVQDNYVVQWGRPEGSVPPENIIKTPPPEYDWTLMPRDFKRLNYRDAYARQAGYLGSWPAANDGQKAWLVHCYGMIGVGRDMAPDTGNGGELYTVIGHAPRHLDRNITVVGRVVAGMENLTARPRGTEALGFYKEPAEQIGFVSAKIASDIPIAERPNYQALRTTTPVFENWLHARANRGGPFFIRAAQSVDICNAQVPIRASR